MFWGLTPALDLLEQYQNVYKNLPNTINILLIGGHDGRHILQTLARRYRYNTKVQLNFYVVEASIETVAKQILLLNVALQHQSVMGLVPKTRIFMELYGNTLVRPSVAKYLTTISNELLKMITDFAYLKKKMPFVSIELKYKERDYLENLLKFWCGGSAEEFNICEAWDRRLRKSLGVRYDSKVGAFDWDLHMRFHSIGGSQVCNQEYRSFRQTGVAFNWLESEVSTPNRSMVCVVVPNGEKFLHYGYLGDMQTGPFVTYGLHCEDGSFLHSTNGQNTYRATDVTERNLSQIFYEIQNNEKYSHQGISDIKLGAVTMRENENRVVDFNAPNIEIKTKNNKCIDLEQVEIKFISISHLDLMKFRQEYKKMFNLIYFGNCYLKHFSNDLIENITAEEALLLVENQKFILNHRDKQLKEFEDEINNTVNGVSMEKLPFDVLKDNFALFRK